MAAALLAQWGLNRLGVGEFAPVALAVVAVLSTMLVRFPWFRRILLTEKRDWPERLVFAASIVVRSAGASSGDGTIGPTGAYTGTGMTSLT